MKTEQQIKEEIRKHKEAITHVFNEMTLEEKIHSWIISTLEWVLGGKTNG